MINHKVYDRGNLYLSGGMEYATDLGAGWREESSLRLKQMKYFPIDIAALDKAYTATFGHPYIFLEPENILQYKSNIRKQIIHTDIQLVIEHSHAIIVLYDESVRRGAGTISECQITYTYNLPLFLVNAYPQVIEIPGWLRALTTKIFTNFEQLYTYLESLPYGILKPDLYGNRRCKDQYLCSLCGEVFKKHGALFVSHISPLYCKTCVEIVKETHERQEDRYDFFVQQMELESYKEINL